MSDRHVQELRHEEAYQVASYGVFDFVFNWDLGVAQRKRWSDNGASRTARTSRRIQRLTFPQLEASTCRVASTARRCAPGFRAPHEREGNLLYLERQTRDRPRRQTSCTFPWRLLELVSRKYANAEYWYFCQGLAKTSEYTLGGPCWASGFGAPG